MFWLIKIIKNTALAVGIMLSTACFYACESSITPSKKTVERQFDLPAFFDREIKRLATDNKEIIKTVSTDDNSESKNVVIDNWSKELSAFAAIDLNKSAYLGYVEKDSSDHLVTLRINNPDLEVSEVVIRYDEQNTPAEIIITRRIQNFLYTTKEKLSYRKNKDYNIEKQQDVWMLGSHRYRIQGEF